MELVRFKPKSIWDPFSDLKFWGGDIDRVFDTFYDRPVTRVAIKDWYPAVDVLEEKDRYTVKAELPGVKQEDIKISLDDNVLTLKGERKSETEKKDDYYYRERVYGEFSRSFRLPTDVDAEKIEATYQDGVLKVDIPKSEEVKPKEISITVK